MLRRKKMQDYIKRLLIAGLMALCVSLLFLGGKHSQAEMLEIPEMTSHWIWPADGVITDVYGTRHGHHKGIDIAAEVKTPIHTVDHGVVTKSYYSGSYGHVVFIKHDNGLETVYAHLNKRMVKEGQIVKQGDMIGEMGNTGDSSGVHLHFEIHQGEWTYEKENAVNPILALGEAAIGQPIAALEKLKSDGALETIARLRMADDIQLGENLVDKAVSPAEGESIVHAVKSGETLWSLAQRYKTTVELITTVNGIKNNHISSGDKLIIKHGEQNNYIVLPGDTLHSIAAKTKISVQELMKLNKLTSDLIQPEQKLILK
jgi:LysM repeat protein